MSTLIFLSCVVYHMVMSFVFRFNKWGEINALREKYLARQELKEKLNYQHFLDLGLHTRELNPAKSQFSAWLVVQNQHKNQAIAETADLPSEGLETVFSNMSAEDRLASLLKGMTVEDTQFMLRRWHTEAWRA